MKATARMGPRKKPLSTEDYNKYLAKVYSAGDFKKPRDAIGLAKTQPPDAMKKLILENTPVTDPGSEESRGCARECGPCVFEQQSRSIRVGCS